MYAKTLGKTELVDSIAKSTNVPKTVVSKVFDSLIDTIKHEAFQKGEVVTIQGFGRFEKKTRSGKIRHIKSKKLMEFETSRLAFKCSNALKD